MKYILLILLSLLTLSCASNPVFRLGAYTYTHNTNYADHPVKYIPIWIDKNFGEADRVSIDNAVNQWNYSLNGYIILKVVDYDFDMEMSKVAEQQKDGGWLVLKVDEHNSAIHDNKTAGLLTLGTSNSDKGYLYIIRDRLTNDDIEGISMHEMGHLLSDPSHSPTEGLMYYEYSRAMYQCVDYAAIERVSKKYDIPIKNMNYCDNGN
jgi:predicted Zn-dependent protease